MLYASIIMRIYPGPALATVSAGPGYYVAFLIYKKILIIVII